MTVCPPPQASLQPGDGNAVEETERLWQELAARLQGGRGQNCKWAGLDSISLYYILLLKTPQLPTLNLGTTEYSATTLSECTYMYILNVHLPGVCTVHTCTYAMCYIM